MQPSSFPYYPINDFGPMMKGLVIGGLGIFHVFLAQFAIGGGMLMCYFQHIASKGASEPAAAPARKFLDSYFRFLVLLSFVVGALTGVGMWFTSIQISPRTIGLMIDEFHWVWATEWTFFCLEVVAGYAFYRYAPRLNDRARMTLLVLYSFAAWMSLFWINGILAFQLTPGNWTQTGHVWAGFFNPTFLPSLIYRTVACLVIASLVSCIVINTVPEFTREQRTMLINKAAILLLPMVLMPVLGLWFLAAMPEDSRGYVLGGSVAMTLFLNLVVVASFLIGGYAVIGLWRQKLYINGATATLMAALAFLATAGGEFVREGVRKPFSVRQTLYSNAIKADEIAQLRAVGSVTHDPYDLRNAASYANDQLRLGAKVFRMQCAICHTTEGVNGLTHLTKTWTTEQKRMNIAKLQRTKPFMPPFAGTPQELEALVQLIEWINAERPEGFPDSSLGRDAEANLEKIAAWLEEVGTQPGYIDPAKTDKLSRTD